MPEFVPPPPELREQSEDESPRAETMAERIGDRVFKWFDRGRADERRGFLSGAIGDALETVLVRVILTFAIPIFSGFIIFAFLWAARSMGRLIDIRPLRDLWYQWDGARTFENAALVIAAAIASVAGIVSTILPLAETERTGPKLNWAIFLFIAFGTICFSSAFLPALVIVTGQFGIHWMIHSAIRLRERRVEWAWELVRAEARAERTANPRLLQNYAGIRGFEDGAEKRPADTED